MTKRKDPNVSDQPVCRRHKPVGPGLHILENRMKKIGIALLIVTALIALTGCSGRLGNGFATATPSGSATPTPLEEVKSLYHVCGGEVVLASYDKLTKPAKGAAISDAELEEELTTQLNDALSQYPNYIPDESRNGTEIKTGDIVNIDFVGKLDGEAFSGGTGKGYDLEVGKYQFIKDFEDGLIGKTVGTTFDIDATFPEDYGKEELNGKAVVFTITVNYVGTEKEGADDAYIKRLSEGEYESIDAYREALREMLQSEKDENYDEDVFNTVIDQMVANSEFKTILDDDVEFYANDMLEYYQSMAAYYSMGIEDFAGMAFGSYDEMMRSIDDNATNYVKQYMVLQQVVKQENITVSDEKYKEMIAGYMETANYESQEEFEEAYTKEYLLYCMQNDLALEFLVEKAKVVD